MEANNNYGNYNLYYVKIDELNPTIEKLEKLESIYGTEEYFPAIGSYILDLREHFEKNPTHAHDDREFGKGGLSEDLFSLEQVYRANSTKDFDTVQKYIMVFVSKHIAADVEPALFFTMFEDITLLRCLEEVLELFLAKDEVPQSPSQKRPHDAQEAVEKKQAEKKQKIEEPVQQTEPKNAVEEDRTEKKQKIEEPVQQAESKNNVEAVLDHLMEETKKEYGTQIEAQPRFKSIQFLCEVLGKPYTDETDNDPVLLATLLRDSRKLMLNCHPDKKGGKRDYFDFLSFLRTQTQSKLDDIKKS